MLTTQVLPGGRIAIVAPKPRANAALIYPIPPLKPSSSSASILQNWLSALVNSQSFVYHLKQGLAHMWPNSK